MATLQNGTRIGDRYIVEGELGRGASAVVFLANDLQHDRQVAVKCLHKELSYALGAQRFLREIRITAKMQHPHILPIHDSGEWNNTLYYVMPKVDGESLRAKLQRERELSVEETVRIASEVADGLEYAHAQGVVHRDIKPENILLSGEHALIADFGIARGNTTLGTDTLTSAGMVLGTAAYMSPEQASGDLNLDARSDIYSLACVVYEMLAGVPPFVGASDRAVMSQRLIAPPPPISSHRPDVPPHIVATLEKALAGSPAARFRSMREFSLALQGKIKSGKVASVRAAQRRTRVALAAAALLAVVVLAGTLMSASTRASLFPAFASTDTTLYVVVPFSDKTHNTSSAAQDAAAHLYSALQQWKELKLIPDSRVSELLGPLGTKITLADALKIGRSVGAGRVIWGSLGAGSEPTQASLYDTRSGELITEDALRLAENSNDTPVAYASLTTSLLGGRNRPEAARGGEFGTRNFQAWREYNAGHAELANWNLQAAEKHFVAAAEIDPDYAQAQLWQTVIRGWRVPFNSDQIAIAINRAAARSSTLSTREKLLTQALLARTHDDVAGACEGYRTLIRRDSADFIGWYGLADCLAKDQEVLADSHSPSGWRFRSSYREARQAYLHATEIEPRLFSVLPFDNLLKIAPVSSGVMRRGLSREKNPRWFMAYPSLNSDTIGFVPYPLNEAQRAVTSATLASATEAMRRNRDSLVIFALHWTQRFPNSSEAYQYLAHVQEARGEIAIDRQEKPSALNAIRRAISFATDDAEKNALKVREVTLLVKNYDFGAAQKLGDSLLRSSDSATRISGKLAGVAALTGHIFQSAGYVSSLALLQPSGRTFSEEALQPARAPAAKLFVFAALGACSDSMDVWARDIDRVLDSYTLAPDRVALRGELTARAWTLAVPCRGAATALRIKSSREPLTQVQQQLARGNVRAVRAHVDSLARQRETMRPGDITIDQTFQEAWLLLAIGDTTGAIRHLDLSLGALPTLSRDLVTQVAQTGGLLRAMMLRADLAASRKDTRTAALWAARVATLWKNADPVLHPQLQRMQLLARGN